ALAPTSSGDTAGIAGFETTNGATVLIAVSNYQHGRTNGYCLREFQAKTHTITDVFPTQSSSSGALATGDLDGDGVLELFVAGRVVPAKYPEAASSLLLRRESGKWVPHPSNVLFTNIGLVS